MKKALLIAIILLNLRTLRAQDTLLGIDLSYANEMNDCGAIFHENGQAKDVYQIFADHRASIVRLRLWHTPGSTNYSTFADVKRSIIRAKDAGMKVLLDFHYSDTWADPGNQTRPAAWSGITDLNILTDSLYNYTYKVLSELNNDGLLPEYVQIGNETNGNIVVESGEPLYPLNWPRNVRLFEAGINAAKAVSNDIQTVIHIADPSNAIWWFSTALDNELNDFDIIGLSYYPQWHNLDIAQLGTAVSDLHTTFGKPVWIVETGYPWTLDNNGDAGNILGEASILPGYVNPPTINSQKNFLIQLTYTVLNNGGMGVIYWEPDWVSTPCYTQWGQGSHYENATFFNFNNQLHEGIDFLTYDYTQPPSITSSVNFYVDMTGVDVSEGVFVTGDFTGEAWQFMPMTSVGNHIYRYSTTMQKGAEGAYIFTKKADWDAALFHEQVPLECAPHWDTHRGYSIADDEETYAFIWSTCTPIPLSVENHDLEGEFSAYPNPFNQELYLMVKNLDAKTLYVISSEGKTIAKYQAVTQTINTSSWKHGIYILQLSNENNVIIESIKVLKTNI